MKTEVNESFSALSFQVFHAEDDDLNYTAIRAPIARLRGGLSKIHAVLAPGTVASDEARTVFFSFVGNMERHAAVFADSLERKDRAEMTSSLSRIAKTCNDCHHFFRLDQLQDVPVQAVQAP